MPCGPLRGAAEFWRAGYGRQEWQDEGLRQCAGSDVALGLAEPFGTGSGEFGSSPATRSLSREAPITEACTGRSPLLGISPALLAGLAASTVPGAAVTVVKWHRMGFRLFWRWKSRSRVGRPRATPELRALIRRMAEANPTWGAPRIHGELLKLGMAVGQTTVARYMPRPGRGAPKPSPTWRNFLRLHLAESAGMDFFVIPTATFGVLLGFVVVSHRDRRILHLNVTAHPTEEWTKQQLREAFPWTSAPRYLHRDRDKLYSEGVRATLTHLGIREVPSAARCPWQNPYAERVIGSIRRELLDHVVVLNEAHARRLLREYQRYYNASRTHLSRGKDAPETRKVQGPEHGSKVIELREVFGLHHRYERRAA
ncbi:integrase core domain-containing protein [Myxococcus stipitatus]|uniref:integrase core domain-containing protein n=1 Tax=Myxococcus stipitatus TaxID=83455 RepID=UPI002DD42153|nr:integrase core domain-containing protein [Myxococcus stipitatus]